MSVSWQGLRKLSRSELALIYPNALIAHRKICGDSQGGIHNGRFATRLRFCPSLPSPVSEFCLIAAKGLALSLEAALVRSGCAVVLDSPGPQRDLQGV